MNKLIRAMLKNRGYDEDFLSRINTCDHALPSGIPELCARLDFYRKTGGRIVVLADFDTDGLMSGVIGFAGLAEMGFSVALYLPSTDGYGFDAFDIEKIKADYSDVKVILTGDVGIAAHEGVQAARDSGIEVLVTDHHKAAVVSNSHVFVDPMCDENPNVFGSVCGAHVMYLVLRYYAEHFHEQAARLIPQIDRLRVFAGIATVADSMPVYHENRPMIVDAVSICRLLYADGQQDVVNSIPGCDIYRRAMLGVFVMLQAFAEHGKIRDSASIDETFFGFYVSPALNSVKRMNGDIRDVYTVFFGGYDAARVAMEKILSLTSDRKALVSKSLDQILDNLEDQAWAPYIYVTDAPGGIRGLLAQRILSLTGEPVLVVCQEEDGSFAGSGRSPAWFPFLELIGDTDTVHPAGHNAAFGVRIDSEQACEDLVVHLRRLIREKKPDDLEALARPDFTISTVDVNADTGIDLELFEEYLEEIEHYRPFGVGFREPDAYLEFRPQDASWSYMGKDHTHLKVLLPLGLVLVCFNQAKLFPNGIDVSNMPEIISVRGKLNMNEWNGNRTIQFLGQLDGELAQIDDVTSAVPSGQQIMFDKK